MKEKLLNSIIGDFSSSLSKQLFSTISNTKDEIEYFINDGIVEYLYKQKQKFSYTKTLLHRAFPVYLYNIYQPLNLMYNENIVSTSSINEVFLQSRFITIEGTAGSGKSTLVKHLFINAIKEQFNIPILISLRYLNDYKESIEEYIKEQVFNNKLSKNDTILIRLLEQGRFVFFLDGYDEIKSGVRQSVIKSIVDFIDKFSKNRFLLTSRPYSNLEYLPQFHNYKIVKFTVEEMTEFVEKQINEKTLAAKIISSIQENKSGFIRDFLSNPLLLSLYILTFKTNSSIPDKKYIFYRRVIDTLFSEHDSISKLGYEREKKSGLTQEELESILKRFSFLSYYENKYDFDKDYLLKVFSKINDNLLEIDFSVGDVIHDLKVSTSLWTEDGGVFEFAHRSIQEYFAALYLETLDSTNKRRAYEILKGKVRSNKFQEISNFLILCQEIDKSNFYKFYSLPLLSSILEGIFEKGEMQIFKSFKKQLDFRVNDLYEYEDVVGNIEIALSSSGDDVEVNLLISAFVELGAIIKIVMKRMDGNSELKKRLFYYRDKCEIIAEDEYFTYYKADIDNLIKDGFSADLVNNSKTVLEILNYYRKRLIDLSIEQKRYIADTERSNSDLLDFIN